MTAEKDVGQTLYAVILAGLIEWAGETADLEDCRAAARHLTPAVRAYVTACGHITWPSWCSTCHPRSRWSPGHDQDCKRFPTGWLCVTDCSVPADACVFPPGEPAP